MDIENYGDRFAGVQLRSEQRRQNEETERYYRERQLARADARGERDEQLARNQDSLYSAAREDVSSGGSDTAAYAAMTYAKNLADIVALTAAGRYGDAYKKTAQLKASADTHHDVYGEYAVTPGRDQFEQNLSVAGRNLFDYGFYGQNVKMLDGTVTTVGALYSSPQAFHDFEYNRVVGSQMTTEFANLYRKSQEEGMENLHDALSKVAGPVVRQGGTAPGDETYAMQYSDVGTYVAKNWDAMVNELGEDGVNRLIGAAVAKPAITSGTGVMLMDNVRKWLRDGNADDKSGSERVRDALSLFDGLNRRFTDPRSPSTPGDIMRFSAKTLDLVLGSSDGAAVNLNDTDVRDRIDEFAALAAEFKNRGTPLYTSLTEGGADVRKGVSDYVLGKTLKDGSNLVDNLENFLELSSKVFSDQEKDAYNMTVPSIVKTLSDGLISDLTKVSIGPLARGGRADKVLVGALGSEEGDLINRWAYTISSTCGLSDVTSEYLARHFSTRLASTGLSCRITDELRDLSFNKSTPEPVAKELRRWYKGNEMAVSVLRPKLEPYRRLLMDKTLGQGLTSTEADMVVAHTLVNTLVPAMEAGVDVADKIQSLTSVLPVYEATGSMIVPGVNGPVPMNVVKNALKSVKDPAAGGSVQLDFGGKEGKVSVPVRALYAAYPEVSLSPENRDLRTYRLRGIEGLIPDVPAGTWSIDQSAVLRQQQLMKMLYLRRVNKVEEQTQKNYSKVEDDMFSSFDGV